MEMRKVCVKWDFGFLTEAKLEMRDMMIIELFCLQSISDSAGDLC